ncbi:MAG: nickel-dependent lactate racemase [Desulfobacterota bacterium]|nr:nickel-dependent lactate racemase [Thermodesulfobacteriota bacterium]
MRHLFPYRDFGPMEIPEENLMGVFSPSILDVEKAEEAIIEEALSHPVGSDPLARILTGRERILLAVDDYTRSTPVQKILPALIRRLEEAGIPQANIRILIALGTHRPMSPQEMVQKFGKEFCQRFTLLNHEWWNPSQLVHLGETRRGTPVVVNRIVQEVDFIIGVGQIVPHRVSGFSGGGNIIQPGICGEETTGKTHWLSARFRGREILGKVENPVKEEIEEVALKAGLRWIVNTIQDGTGRTVDAVAGDPVLAYRQGGKRSLEVYKAELPADADIVVVDSHPYDSELWLAAKGIYASELAVKQGGVVVLVSPCPEGVSPSHPEVLEFGYQTYEEAERLYHQGKIRKLTAAAHLVHVGRVIKERARAIFVAKGISKAEKERLGFLHAETPQEALEMAFSLLGRKAKVAVLQRGGEVLPVSQESP